VEYKYDIRGGIMYSDAALTNHLQQSNAIETKSKILAEWNLNTYENIEVIGNYKNTPITTSPYKDTSLPSKYSLENEDTLEANRKWYKVTDYDTTIDGGYTDAGGTPVTFSSPNLRQTSLMSLEDCFKKFRPRSGINKLRGFSSPKNIIPVSGTDVFSKPRYYPAGPNDNFKYWSSYTTKNNIEYGISALTSPYTITNAAPFIKYKNKIPTNKIVVKIQTNVSNVDSGAIIDPTNASNKDPFYVGSSPNYKSTPQYWQIQKLDSGNNWVDLITTDTNLPGQISSDQFTSTSGWDGYFQISYGIKNIPSDYANNFNFIGTLLSTSALPNIQGSSLKGQAYLVKTSTTDKGIFYIYNGGTDTTVLNNYYSLTPSYGWYISKESITNSQLFITELDTALAPSYTENSTTVYREFEYINGLRIVVNGMIGPSTTFDLIELSPRLAVDLTDITSSFSLKKYASDLGISSLPVGQLLASTGTMSIFDYNQVFNANNKKSILNVYESDTLKFSFISKNLQLKFYEIVSKVKQTDKTYKDYYIPLKTMYSDGFPQYDDSNRTLSITLRDFVFYLESQIAPEILLINASTSYIVATLLDSIGFSNYTFSRLSNENDVVIPYFMISPNKTIMQILQDLAIATQTTMFFDESNNFVVMGKKYLVPDDKTQRDATITLYGSDVPVALPASTNFPNLPTQGSTQKANIINISSQSNDIYNDGKITYYDRYIQKQSNKISTYSIIDKYQDISYKRSVLWSIADTVTKKIQSKNEEDPNATSFTLSAIPLSVNLSNVAPSVSSGAIVNNTIEFGDGVWWIQRYQGNFYANGEIIKYDAIQYKVGDSTYWITSNDEYNKYFLKLTNGQKMYKTGKVRIYAEPKYDSSGNITAIVKHGRAQFGTTIATHNAGTTGLDSSWTTPQTPLITNWQYLFKKTISDTVTTDINTNASAVSAKKMSTPTTTIKNFLSIPQYNTKTRSMQYSESVQASALSLNGPKFEAATNNGPSINYVKKELGASVSYDTFGTRLRILGSKGKNKSFQTPTSSYEAYSVQNAPNVSTNLTPSTINGASGGISISTNSYGEGYYYEIVALDYLNTDLVRAKDLAEFNNLIFYKMDMVKDGYTTTLIGDFSSNDTILQGPVGGNGTLQSSLPGNPTTFAVNDRIEIRVKDGTQNSLYIVTSLGSSSSKWKLTKVVPVLKPTILYSTFTNIFVDTGKFTSKVLSVLDGDDSIYDLGIKLNKVNDNNWVFGIYMNNVFLKTVQDTSPIRTGVSQNISLFTRGSSQMMFENVYALKTMTSKPTGVTSSTNIFDATINENVSYSKYALGPLVKTGFLSSLSPSSVPENQIYYEEFGTIMRECAYFNVKFDKAYPALRSIISPTPASLGGYLVTGYTSTPYRAEFLVFNTTDFALSLGDGKNYSTILNITGIGFTSETAKELTVDSFYNNRGNYSTNSDYKSETYKNKYIDIKNNRTSYGNKSFEINSPYIQNQETATELMDYIINKISKPRKAVAVETFGMPIIQLGDLVKFSYDTTKTLPTTVTDSNFVVYAIEHERKETGPSTILYLSEVV